MRHDDDGMPIDPTPTLENGLPPRHYHDCAWMVVGGIASCTCDLEARHAEWTKRTRPGRLR